MSNEKMREEFEAALWRDGIPSGWIISNKHLFEKDKFSNYAIPYVQGAWFGWKASRAALCVELPLAWYQDQEGYILNREDDIKSSLDDAGVRYK